MERGDSGLTREIWVSILGDDEGIVFGFEFFGVSWGLITWKFRFCASQLQEVLMLLLLRLMTTCILYKFRCREVRLKDSN